MFKRIYCLLSEHVPDRRKVTVRSERYYCPCQRCGTRLRRARRNHWVKSWPWQ